ncbi:hypothetical protein AX14_009100 [Amanita brunnescens Koide BX004]|nr:hypothetical protein AX14_009100 [Amanita brunnescens Koide BX004]
MHPDRITIDTASPKKGTELFKAWVRNLKKEIHQMHETSDGAIVYTDGAYHHSDHKAAYAFTVFDSGSWYDRYGWCPAASSFDAEMRAIESTLEHIVTRTAHSNVTIIIDNKAAANALFNFDVKSSQMTVIRINALIAEWFANDQSRHLTIRFAPSHEGIPGNECADDLTKAGLGLCPMNPPTILRSHFIASQKRQAEAEWQRLWNDVTYRGSQWLPIRRKKKTFKPSFAKAARNFFHNLAKGEPSHLSRLAHVLTNHAPTGEYRTRFFLEEPTACPRCDENTLQTRHHIMSECPGYVNGFASMTDWGKLRNNDTLLMGFLDRNPLAFTFGDVPLDVH